MTTTFDLIIKGGLVATPGGIAETDVGVNAGKITRVSVFRDSCGESCTYFGPQG